MAATARSTISEEVPARFTAREFAALAEVQPIVGWSGKIELVKGIVTRMAPANIPHWTVQRLVFTRLYDALRDVETAWIVGQEPTVRLADDTVREPDVAILRDPGPASGYFDRSALLLAIEIADSSLAIDLHVKRLSYAEAGVAHYWVVDINDRCVHLMARPVSGDYAERAIIPFGKPLAVPGTDRTIVID